MPRAEEPGLASGERFQRDLPDRYVRFVPAVIARIASAEYILRHFGGFAGDA